jgi:glycosyltransferase involved in cell wall biosynthesis
VTTGTGDKQPRLPKRVLVLAPQPFFQERGTPIAVRLLLEELGQQGHQLQYDLLVYNEGTELELPGVTVYRANPGPFWGRFVQNIRPGASVKKLLYDVIYSFYFLKLLVASYCQRRPYSCIYAVEEAVFLAWIARLITRTPYIYDMDSLLGRQLTEHWSFLRFFSVFFRYLETTAMRGAFAVVPVCQALGDTAQQVGVKRIILLPDISLIDDDRENTTVPAEEFRKKFALRESHCIVLYVGNFERYQGIGLLLDSIAALTMQERNDLVVILVGGSQEDREFYSSYAVELGIQPHVVFAGPRPLAHLGVVLTEADILVSPRLVGNNTPMKVYSYLASGKPVVATAIESHTQVLNSDIARLVEPTPQAFGRAILDLSKNKELQGVLGLAGQRKARTEFSRAAFRDRVSELYDCLIMLSGETREKIDPCDKARPVLLNEGSSSSEIRSIG